MNASHVELLLRGAAQSRRVLSLAGGLPDEDTFPRAEIAAAAQRAILVMGTAPLQYDWPEGRQPLRAMVAASLRARGADVEPEDVLITNGAQDAIGLSVDVLAPEAVQIDALSYPGAIEVFRSRGCRLTPSAEAVRYVMPALSNPDGRVATARERARMLDARWIIEDDAYAELVFDEAAGRPLLAEARAQVFHIGTFSKVISPGLRVGWLVPPRTWLPRVRNAKMRRDLHACGLAQAIVEQLLRTIDYKARMTSLRARYRRRCERLVESLRQIPRLHFHVPAGGFSVWAELELAVSEAVFLERAIAEGVVFDPGSRFRFDAAERPLALRLSYSCVDEAYLPVAAERLHNVVDRLAAARAA